MATNTDKTPDLQTVKVAVVAVSLAHKKPGTEDYQEREQYVKQALGQTNEETLHTTPFYKDTAKTKIAGCVITTKDHIFVAYHGTKFDSKSEVGHDLQASKSSMNFGDKECDVHTGFKTEFELSQQNMEKALQTAMNKNKEASVIFTGHSLGGAVSQIAALKYTTEQDTSKFSIPSDKVQNITFGAPRVFGRKAANLYTDKLNAQTLRIKLRHDPVTGLPPANMGFHHVGKKVQISGVGHTGGTYRKHTNKINETKIANAQASNDYSIGEYITQVMVLTKQAFRAALQGVSQMINKFEQRSAHTSVACNISAGKSRQQNQGISR